jgi:hypothetical protein
MASESQIDTRREGGEREGGERRWVWGATENHFLPVAGLPGRDGCTVDAFGDQSMAPGSMLNENYRGVMREHLL